VNRNYNKYHFCIPIWSDSKRKVFSRVSGTFQKPKKIKPSRARLQ